MKRTTQARDMPARDMQWDEERDMQWDEEVDVLCTDAGVAGLAGAISAVDAGCEVLVAAVPVSDPSVASGAHAGWFPIEIGDTETATYLAELSADLDEAALLQRGDALPIRQAPRTVAAAGRRIPPFIGSELRDWNARCITSPSGYLYTRVTDWNSAAMEATDGDAIEVTEIGSVTAGSDGVVGSVLEWLEAEAKLRGVDVYQVTRLERLVFDGRDVIGAVFTAVDGPWAVRARHGVLLCRNGFRAVGPPRLPTDSHAGLRVALVGKTASRFGRVELLVSEPVIG